MFCRHENVSTGRHFFTLNYMSYRIDQVNQLIREEISPIIGGIKDKYLGLVTVINVEATSDLNQAKVWISVMNKDDLEDNEIIKIIKNHVFGIQEHLKKRLFMKRIPRLVFKVDRSNTLVADVDKIFKMIEDGGNLPLDR